MERFEKYTWMSKRNQVWTTDLEGMYSSVTWSYLALE